MSTEWTDEQNQKWKDNLITFLGFRSTHGEEVCPSKHSKDANEKELFNWVADQQESYAQIASGSKPTVPKELIDLLSQVKNLPLEKHQEAGEWEYERVCTQWGAR